jgi:hypothetical protein
MEGWECFLRRIYLYIFTPLYVCLHDSVHAVAYKPEGRGFQIRLGEILNLPNSSGHTRL